MNNSKFQIIVADPPWDFSDSLSMSNVARGAKANYNTMSIGDIKALSISEISDPDGALLALWVPSSLLQEGLDTLKAWGFTHKQTYIWVKTKKESLKSLLPPLLENVITTERSIQNRPGIFNSNKFKVKTWKEYFINSFKGFALTNLLSFGMGRLFRQTHEICLIGTNNNKIYKLLENKSQRSVSFGENLKHSAKPEHLQDSLEIMFPKAKKIELFARRLRKDWVCLGNEICVDENNNPEDIRDSLKKLYSL